MSGLAGAIVPMLKMVAVFSSFTAVCTTGPPSGSDCVAPEGGVGGCDCGFSSLSRGPAGVSVACEFGVGRRAPCGGSGLASILSAWAAPGLGLFVGQGPVGSVSVIVECRWLSRF